MRTKTETKWGITLTPRQWATYRLLKEKLKVGDTATQKEIYENYPYDSNLRKDGYVWNDSPKTHDHCVSVWNDINEINNNPDIHKVIISNNFVYHIATSKAEITEFIHETYYKPAMAKLYRYSVMKNKVARNGQGKLVFDDKSKARDYWETFINDLVEMSCENE